MSVFVGSVVLNTNDVGAGIAFWTAALGYVVRHADSTFAVLTDPNRRWANVSLQLTDEPKAGLNRLHLDLYTPDQEGEVIRLEGLGALRVPWEYPPHPDFVVLADPSGNEFCVVQSPYTQEGPIPS